MNLSILKNKNFLLLLFGQSTSLIGGQLFNISLSLYVLDITGSATKFASILAVGVIPQMILYPFAGVIVDRVDRKKLIILLDTIMAIFFILIYLVTLEKDLSTGYIYLITFVLGICQTLFLPAIYTIIPFMFENDDYEDAYTCNNLVNNLSVVVSPLLGALLYTAFGIKIVILINGITFLVSAMSELFIKLRHVDKSTSKVNVIKDIKEGFTVLFGLKSILLFTSAFILFRILVLPFFQIVLPYFFKEILQSPNYYIGITRTVGIVGGFIGLLFVSRVKRKYGEIKAIELLTNREMILYIPLLLIGLNYTILFLKNNPIYALITICIFLLVDAILNSTVNVFYTTFYTRQVPKELLGRFATTRFSLYSLGMTLGYNLYGFLLDKTPLIVPMATVVLGALAVMFLVSRSIKLYRETSKQT